MGVPVESALNLVSRVSPCGAYDSHYAVLGVTITCQEPAGYGRYDILESVCLYTRLEYSSRVK